MSKIFSISGLGADTRLYDRIDFGLEHSITPIEWIDALPSDSLVTYAQKLIDQYDIKKGSILIGTSLGGMLAVEIAKIVNPAKVILISSIKTIDEAPWYFSVFKRLPVYQFLPGELFKHLRPMIRLLFGKMSDNDLGLFNDMLQRNSPVFMKWAMGAVVKWENQIIPPNLYHIHGDADLVFPAKNIKNATIVDGGTHIIVFNRANEINEWLKPILEK